MRGATRACVGIQSHNLISIHAPHARSDGPAGHLRCRSQQNFNPRSSCEERHNSVRVERQAVDISIHAPHARSDLDTSSKALPPTEFQSTLLMRGATSEFRFSPDATRLISIHAPHARSDGPAGHLRCRSQQNFNPRSSCEERLRPDITHKLKIKFQSTLLMRGATRAYRQSRPKHIFQSTLLMRGATTSNSYAQLAMGFQSTLLMRGATAT